VNPEGIIFVSQSITVYKTSQFLVLRFLRIKEEILQNAVKPKEESLKPGPQIKVRHTLAQALRLCTGRTAHRRCRGIAVLYRH